MRLATWMFLLFDTYTCCGAVLIPLDRMSALNLVVKHGSCIVALMLVRDLGLLWVCVVYALYLLCVV
ncbi:hypothetical protein F4604DRAFT_1308645 [Suillus subluteus]|nr:hypothetical protein F4604DRAFT_1308645 [Suillus subluteus]